MFPSNASLVNQNISDTAFAMGKDDKGNNVHLLFIKELYHLCENAVSEFKKDIDAVVPASKQGKIFH